MDQARKILETITKVRATLAKSAEENTIIHDEKKENAEYFEAVQKDLAKNVDAKAFRHDKEIVESKPKIEIRLGEPGDEMHESELTGEQKQQLQAIKDIMTP